MNHVSRAHGIRRRVTWPTLRKWIVPPIVDGNVTITRHSVTRLIPLHLEHDVGVNNTQCNYPSTGALLVGVGRRTHQRQNPRGGKTNILNLKGGGVELIFRAQQVFSY
jgi:hypothetical protein